MTKRATPWGFLIVTVLLVAIVGLCGMGLIAAVTGGAKPAGDRIALIELNGEITDTGGSSGLSRTPGARDFINDIEDARKDSSIKAVVIRIDSPGGSAAASQEMYHAVRKLGKPVICSMGDLAASGGYYVASACDTLYANGSTLTGSIGVISQFMNYQGLFKKVGLATDTIKSGVFKDAGNPDRPLTPAEKALFQATVMNVYYQFVDDVAAGRKGKLTRAQVLKLADGRVYTGTQAKANGLIDVIGGLQDAIAAAQQRAGLHGEPVIKDYGSSGMLGSLLGARADALGMAAGAAAGASFAQALRQGVAAGSSVPLPLAR